MTIFTINNENTGSVRLISDCKLKNGKSIPKDKAQYRLAIQWGETSTNKQNSKINRQKEIGVLVMGVSASTDNFTESNIITTKIKRIRKINTIEIFEIPTLFLNAPGRIPTPLIFFYKKNCRQALSQDIISILKPIFLDAITYFQAKIQNTLDNIDSNKNLTIELERNYQFQLEILADNVKRKLIKQFAEKICIMGLKLDNFYMMWKDNIYSIQDTCAPSKKSVFYFHNLIKSL